MFGVRYSTSQCTIWALPVSVEKIEKSSIQPKWSFDVSVEVIWNSHTLSHGTATVGPIKEWCHQRITVLGERRVVKIYEFCLFFPLMIGSSNPDSPENCNRGEVSYLPVSEITLLHLKNGWDACCTCVQNCDADQLWPGMQTCPVTHSSSAQVLVLWNDPLFRTFNGTRECKDWRNKYLEH